MKLTHSLMAAAVGGILVGATGCGVATPPPAAPAAAEGTPAAASAPAAAAAKHACKGQNDCKGQGGCKSA
jgi:hypothetical protein